MPEQLSGAELAQRLTAATTNVEPHYLVGYLEQVLARIIDGDTIPETPTEYARRHMEELAADAEAGRLPKVVGR